MAAMRSCAALLAFALAVLRVAVAAPRAEPARVRKGSCPVDYRRLELPEIRGGAKPYFLGGRVREEPKDEPNWKKFCAGEGYGAVCHQQTPGKTIKNLVDLLLDAGQDDDLLSTPCDLWPYVEGRTSLLVGDSQMLDLYKAMVCTLREFVDLEAGPPLPPGRKEYGMFKIARPLGEDYSAYSHLPGVPSCIHMKHGTRICFIRLNKAEEMEAELETVKTVVREDDITIINFGLHHRPVFINEEVMPLVDKLVKDKQMGTNLFFKDTTPLHFDSIYGDASSSAVPPFKCRARNLTLNPDGTLSATTDERNKKGERPEEEFKRYNARNLLNLPLVAEAGVPIIHTFNQTVILHDYHRNNGAGHECSHYCWPVQGLWVNSLLKTFRASPPTPLRDITLRPIKPLKKLPPSPPSPVRGSPPPSPPTPSPPAPMPLSRPPTPSSPPKPSLSPSPRPPKSPPRPATPPQPSFPQTPESPPPPSAPWWSIPRANRLPQSHSLPVARLRSSDKEVFGDSVGAAPSEEEVLDVRYRVHEGLSEAEKAELEWDLADLNHSGMSTLEEAELEGDLADLENIDDPLEADPQTRFSFLDSNKLSKHANLQQHGAPTGRKLLR